MKIPDHLRPPLLEQLEDQENSEDCLTMRGSALGHALLENNEKRDFFRKNPRTSMMINMYDKKSKEVKTNYLNIEKDLQL